MIKSPLNDIIVSVSVTKHSVPYTPYKTKRCRHHQPLIFTFTFLPIKIHWLIWVIFKHYTEDPIINSGAYMYESNLSSVFLKEHDCATSNLITTRYYCWIGLWKLFEIAKQRWTKFSLMFACKWSCSDKDCSCNGHIQLLLGIGIREEKYFNIYILNIFFYL